MLLRSQLPWLWAAVAESPAGSAVLPGTLCLILHSALRYPGDLMHPWGKLALNYHSGNYSEGGATDLMSRRLRANEVPRLSLLSSLIFETNNEEDQERTQSETPMEKVSPLKPRAPKRNSRLFSSPRYQNLASYSGNKIFSSPRPLTKGTGLTSMK